MSADRVVVEGDPSIVLDCFGDWGASIAVDCLGYEEGVFRSEGAVQTATVTFKMPHSTAPAFVLLSDASGTSASSQTNQAWMFVDFNKLNGKPVYANQSLRYYGMTLGVFKNTAATVDTIRLYVTSENYNKVTNTGFTAEIRPNGIDTRWIINRNYKWIAIWR